MSSVIRTHLVQIGNSQGVRIPKILLDQLQFDDSIEMEIQDNQLIIRKSLMPRANWAKAFQQMAEMGDDQLLDSEITPTLWDKTEWEW